MGILGNCAGSVKEGKNGWTAVLSCQFLVCSSWIAESGLEGGWACGGMSVYERCLSGHAVNFGMGHGQQMNDKCVWRSLRILVQGGCMPG